MMFQDILFIAAMLSVLAASIVIIVDHFRPSGNTMRIGIIFLSIPILSLIILPFTSLTN